MKKIIFLFILIFNFSLISSKDGTLDFTFNKNGKLAVALGKQFSVLYSVAVQKDEKIVAVGTVDTKFVVIRLNFDGTFDDSFGNKGQVILPVVNINSLRQAIALQPDGKVVITGVGNDQFVLARLNTDGSLDGSFASGGILIFTFAIGIDSNAIQVQKNGKIVIGGDAYAGRALTLIKLENNGNFDPSFTDDVHGAGKVLIQFSLNASGQSVAIQNDGKILICGNIGGFFSVLRVQPDGALDLSFGPFGIGYVSIVSGAFASANSIALQKDGKIVVGGQSDFKFALVRLNEDGSLDTTFNGTGIVETAVDQNASIQGIAIQPWDNKIVVGGYSTLDQQRFTLARYTTVGQLDKTFGNNGIVFTSFNATSNSGINSIALDLKKRKIVAVGYNGNTEIAVARYNASTPKIANNAFINALINKFGC